ncbi:hypothetical protein T492DRAFT_1014769 [Pavlovales sp. CCMP2436]|nr:hypothetical protein T492DRAFT_1014769 [Pavlovales sp. CCMP2436]
MADGQEGLLLEIVSLLCPVTHMRLQQPCRTVHCAPHASSFCSTSLPYLRWMQDGRRQCPICCADFAGGELVVDARLTLFLAESVAERAAVKRHADGSFSYFRPRPPKPALSSHATDARGSLRLPSGVEPWDEGRPSSVDEPGDAEPGLLADRVQLMVRFVPASSGHEERPRPGSGGGAGRARLSELGPAVNDSAEVYAAVMRGAEAGGTSTRAWRCSECNEWVTGDRRRHMSTIAHQFACSVARGQVGAKHIALPEGNRGYRILRDSLGWEEGRGLGKNSEGALQPLATRLKRDRRGLRVMPGGGSDDDDDDDPPRPRRIETAPLRVTHTSNEVMGPGCHSLPESRTDRRAREKTDRKRAAYLKRCKELMVQRELIDLTRP